jgi:hypothetical protein
VARGARARSGHVFERGLDVVVHAGRAANLCVADMVARSEGAQVLGALDVDYRLLARRFGRSSPLAVPSSNTCIVQCPPGRFPYRLRGAPLFERGQALFGERCRDVIATLP